MADKNAKDREGSQRGENSVLFSLSSLTAVGSSQPPAQAPAGSANQHHSQAHKPGVTSSDKSGLIDLKTLTALGAGTTKPAAGGQATPSAEPSVPAIFANSRRSSSKGGLIVAVILVIALCGVAYYLYDKAEKDAAAAAAAAASAKEASEKEAAERDAEREKLAAEAAAEKVRLEKEAAAEREKLATELAEAKARQEELEKLIKDKEAALAAGKSADEIAKLDAAIEAKKDGGRTPGKRDPKAPDAGTKTDTSSGGGGTAATAATAGTPPPKKDDGDILKKYGGDGGSAEAGLADDQIRKVLSAYAGPLKKCRNDQAGDLKVKFTINADGSVSGASASGALAGTPVADCAVAAISKVRFPKSDASKSFTHTIP
jgi:outer membrane biosynthesis protein TonB